MPLNPEQVNQLIASRRSIYPKLYSDERVPDEIISQMIKNANWAPTHRLTEPWRFVIFCDNGLRKLGRLQSDCYERHTKLDGTYDQKKHAGLLEKPLMASHVIAIGMMRDPKQSVPEVEEIEAVAAAVQNMYLTAASYKLGCYWGTGGITYFEEAPALFGFDKLLGFMYVGVPKISWPESKRGDVEEKTKWVR